MGYFEVDGATLKLDIDNTSAADGDTRTVAGETFKRDGRKWHWKSCGQRSLPNGQRVYTVEGFLILSDSLYRTGLSMYVPRTGNPVKIRDDSEPWAWKDARGFDRISYLGNGKFEVEKDDYHATVQLANRDDLKAVSS